MHIFVTFSFLTEHAELKSYQIKSVATVSSDSVHLPKKKPNNPVQHKCNFIVGCNFFFFFLFFSSFFCHSDSLFLFLVAFIFKRMERRGQREGAEVLDKQQNSCCEGPDMTLNLGIFYSALEMGLVAEKCVRISQNHFPRSSFQPLSSYAARL